MAKTNLKTNLLTHLFDDPGTAAEFSDERLIGHLLAVEALLAKVQGELGVIPPDAARRIAASAPGLHVDVERLYAETEKDGFPIIELVRQLREHVGGEAASYVHWGATTQDILDTTLVLQIRVCLDEIDQTLDHLIANLTRLADKYRTVIMAGRTHSQQALPIPFGLKVAGWLAPLLRHRQRLNEIKPRVLIVQLGGAAGTLASLGTAGLHVQTALAAELNLGVPLIPWHTQRDGLAELAGWLSLLTGSLAKMAQDIILLAQTEVGEVRESTDRARGGSSTMPQKSNPVISELIVSAARTNAALLSAMHQALIQEHERATSGWQMEWLTLPEMFRLSAGALNKAVFLSEHLDVDEARMHDNVRASNGLMLAEALNLALAPKIGRAEAKKLVADACQVVLNEHRHLVDVVREKVEVPLNWEALKDESAYLGTSDTLIDRVLHDAREKQPS